MSFEDSVLICDEVDPVLNKILEDNGLKVSYEPTITPEQILEKIPTFNIVIVRSRTTITKEIIEETIQAYAEDDAYCLKFYSAELDTKTLDVLKDRSIARDKLLDDLLEKGQSVDIENYDLIDFNIDNL